MISIFAENGLGNTIIKPFHFLSLKTICNAQHALLKKWDVSSSHVISSFSFHQFRSTSPLRVSFLYPRVPIFVLCSHPSWFLRKVFLSLQLLFHHEFCFAWLTWTITGHVFFFFIILMFCVYFSSFLCNAAKE